MSQAPFEPRMVAFVCNWCTYAGADLAGTSRMAYPPTVRVIRVPCSGRIDPLLALKAFERGADGVIVSGCHPGDCHYNAGNLVARRRFQVTRHLLEAMGLEPGRLHFTWISAAQGAFWAETVAKMTEILQELGPFRRFQALQEETGLPRDRRDLLESLEAPAAPIVSGTDEEYRALESALRDRARTLLTDEGFELVVGYERPARGAPRAVFLTGSDPVERLVFDADCRRGLASYLTRPEVRRQRAAILLRPEDAPAAVVLRREAQLESENLRLVGLGLPEGTPGVDEILGPVLTRSEADLDRRVDALMALPPAERWNLWATWSARCTRCHACRQACPICTCQRCIVERNQPPWVPPSPDGLGGWVWNFVRAYHLAGRCVGCGECARACPEGIPMDLLNRHLARCVQEDFQFDPAADPESAILLAAHQDSDPEDFLGSGS